MASKATKKSARGAKKTASKSGTAKKAKASKASAKKATAKKATAKKAPAKKAPKPKAKSDGKPVLLSGGNPQIPKGDGDAPVQAFIAASPGWKSEASRRLDKQVERAVPKVKKAVRWNSPFYGVEGQGWFLSFHHFDKYIKVTFLNGTSLKPPPPVASKHPSTRYLHIYEDEPVDEKQLTDWLKQAAALPGDPLFE